METSLVIFDLDGTLINSINDLATATNHALATLGYPTHHVSAYPYYVGNGVIKLIERALPSDARTPEIIEKARREFTAYYDLHDTDESVPYPGIPELLVDLADRGIKLAVASNKYQRAVERLVPHFFPQIPWAAIQGQKPDVPTKPDPSIVFEILAETPTPKSQVLYVGDSGVDMVTAARAGVTSVGVTWGFRPESELVANYANHIINHPHSLLSIIDDRLKI